MLLLVKWADNDGIIMLMVVCTSVVKVVEFKACEILSLDQRYKLCLVKKDTKFNQVFFLIKSSEIILIFLPEFLPDYMAHDITKQFWKNIHFENMTAGFILRYENLLWYFTPEMRYENRIILNKKCHSFWPN